MSRHCQISIAASPSWDFVSELDSYCFQSLSHHQIVYSDTSGFACGAIILNNNTQICHRPFTQEERVFSSTRRELIAIEYSLKAFGPILCNSRVKWFTDSQSSVRIVEVGSMQFSLHTLPISIFEFCIRNNIELSVQWIPRSLTQKADSVSNSWISMIGRLHLNSLLCWSNIGVRTPLIASPTFIIQKLKDFPRGFETPEMQV